MTGIKQLLQRRPRRALISLIATSALLVTFFPLQQVAAALPTCSTPSTLDASAIGGGVSNFEIDTSANLKVDGPLPCIDWLAGGTGTAFRGGALVKADLPSGPGDDAFGQGTNENNPNPTIVNGSIPPNKSDLKDFGVYRETNASGKFLNLFWSRVSNPSGTIAMDFELNKLACDGTAATCANNGTKTPLYVTPKRTAGDKLIVYGLANGGTVPTISIYTWSGTAWTGGTVISGGASPEALGSINTSSIAAADSGGLGVLDPLTFGEASISFKAIFTGGTCGSFGSVYLKSRSSNNFTDELKDFIAPQPVTLTNCTTLTTNASAAVTIGSPISDTATLSGTAAGTGTITFHLFNDALCATTEISTGLTPVSVHGDGAYNSGNFTPTAVGTYYWIANYSGDSNNAASATNCGDLNESVVVSPAQPAIVTSPQPGTTNVGATLNDSATLSGGVNPTGSITFKLFTPSAPTCAGTAAFTNTVSVSGNNTYNTSAGLVSDVAGTWHWTAVYTSSNGNNNGASSACTAEPVTVSPLSPSISTTTNPGSATFGDILNDSATLTGGFNPTGTITFRLFAPNLLGDCSAAAAYTQVVTVTANGTYSTSPGLASNAVGTWHWTASYSGDLNNTAVASNCADEPVVVIKLPSAIDTAQSWYPNDQATIGGGGTGSVTFTLYKSTDCLSNSVYTETDAISSGGVAATTNKTFAVTTVALADTYSWGAVYPGDTTHLGVTSCVESTVFTSLTNGTTQTSP